MFDENGELTEKAAYMLFWCMKGHLNTTHKTIMDSRDGYFKRLWTTYDGEGIERLLEGFEEAYKLAMERKNERS